MGTGGGSEGKGPREQKGKETAAKASPEAEMDGVWMADAEANVARYALERFVHQWMADIPRDGKLLWDVSEMAGEVAMSKIMGYETYIDECIASPSNSADATDNLSSKSDILESIIDSCPGLEAVSASSNKSSDDTE